jgi:non-ribosomal peptide synthetase component F
MVQARVCARPASRRCAQHARHLTPPPLRATHRPAPQIDAASNRIAHYLRSQAGVMPGDIVGVLVLRSPLMMAALLGVFKAGAGYLPLDHHHPTSRIEFMLEDAAVKVRRCALRAARLLPPSALGGTRSRCAPRAARQAIVSQPSPSSDLRVVCTQSWTLSSRSCRSARICAAAGAKKRSLCHRPESNR